MRYTHSIFLQASGKTEELLKPLNPASKMLNSPQYKVTANNKSPKIKARVVSSVQLSKVNLISYKLKTTFNVYDVENNF